MTAIFHECDSSLTCLTLLQKQYFENEIGTKK